jgi:excisionase family DNA binding protein
VSIIADLSTFGDTLLTSEEVAALFRVHPKTVGRWGRTGRLRAIRTPGGHPRYKESVVRALLNEDADGQPEVAS